MHSVLNVLKYSTSVILKIPNHIHRDSISHKNFPVSENSSSKSNNAESTTIKLPVATGGEQSTFELKPSRGSSGKKVKAPSCTLL